MEQALQDRPGNSTPIAKSRPWPSNAWYQAAWSSEIDNKPFARTLLNQAIVLFRDADGAVGALEDRCCHRAAPLRLGAMVPEGLQCGYHGMVFDSSGNCVEIPGQERIPPQARVRSFPVVERQEIVWVWMGDPSLADEAEIVDYPWHDDQENWPHMRTVFEIGCSYRLLIDNLMDLTHLPYVHRKTIGGGSTMGQVNARMTVVPTDKGVQYVRWMLGISPPPTYQKAMGWAADSKIDRWIDFEYVAPSTVIHWSGGLEEGRGAEENRDQEGGFAVRLYHGITPETEESCHYFWSTANGFRPGDAEATEALHKEVAFTFREDIEFLELQQSCVAADPDRPMVDIKHDAARKPASRALDKMIRAESKPVTPAAK